MNKFNMSCYVCNLAKLCLLHGIKWLIKLSNIKYYCNFIYIFNWLSVCLLCVSLLFVYDSAEEVINCFLSIVTDYAVFVYNRAVHICLLLWIFSIYYDMHAFEGGGDVLVTLCNG